MKRFYLLTTAVLLSILQTFAANTLNLTRDAVTFEGYTLSQYYNFLSNVYGVDAATEQALAFDSNGVPTMGTETYKTNGTTLTRCTMAGMTDFYFQAIGYSKGFWARGANWGLGNAGTGGRWMSIGNLQAGQIVVLQMADTQGKGTFSAASNVVASPDSANATTGCKYFTIAQDGNFDLQVSRGGYIIAIAIYTNSTAPEFITPPVLKLHSVNGTQREVEITPGVSSKGNDCETFYSFNGADPLYRDAEGKPTKENGAYGDWKYEAGGYIDTSNADSVETGNVVTLQAITISSTGVISDTAKLVVSVGEITLNAPTLTLVGTEGTMRTYKVGWTNNTLCGEEYALSYTTGDGKSGVVSVGDNVGAEKGPITVTVVANGYNDGVATLDKVTQEGRSYFKRNGSTEKHDWDFVSLSAEMLQKLEGLYATDTLKVSHDVTTTDENGKTTTTTQVTDSLVYGYYNWWYASAKNRCNLDVKPDTTITDKKDAEGNPILNADGTAVRDTVITCTYAKDSCNLLNGLTITGCDPYVNSSGTWSSSIFIYTNGSGLWLTSRTPSVIVPGTKLGDLIVYDNAGTVGCVVAQGETATIPLTQNAYLRYIDIYSTNDEVDGIQTAAVVNPDAAVKVYSVDGRLVRSHARLANALQGLQRGIYIVNGKKFVVQ